MAGLALFLFNKTDYMNPNDLRQRFLRYLHYKVFKRKEGGIRNKFCRIIWSVFYPLHAMHAKQSGCHYDMRTDTYTIRGKKFSGSIFNFFNDEAKKGTKFKFIKTDTYGDVTIEFLPENEAQKDFAACLQQPHS